MLNPNKTQAIFFVPRHSASKPTLRSSLALATGIGYHDTFLQKCLKFWGDARSYSFMETLYRPSHKRANRAMYPLRSMRSCTTQKLKQSLVELLDLPHLYYCSMVLLDATNEQKIRLQKLQNCIRYIYGLRRDVHISPYRRRLNCMRKDTRRTYTTSVLLYKGFNIRTPSYLFQLFEKRQSSRPCKRCTGGPQSSTGLHRVRKQVTPLPRCPPVELSSRRYQIYALPAQI